MYSMRNINCIVKQNRVQQYALHFVRSHNLLRILFNLSLSPWKMYYDENIRAGRDTFFRLPTPTLRPPTFGIDFRHWFKKSTSDTFDSETVRHFLATPKTSVFKGKIPTTPDFRPSTPTPRSTSDSVGESEVLIVSESRKFRHRCRNAKLWRIYILKHVISLKVI